MSYELSGILYDKFDVVQVSDRFKKQEFVVKTETTTNSGHQFEDFIKFQLVQDKCGMVDNIAENTSVKVSFNLRGNRSEKGGNVRYFTNLDAWKIETQGEAGTDSAASTGEDDVNQERAEDEDDGMPF
ncbi:MAG: hypothetical protein BRD50_07540 [Bacteroidetes bacterium SW_11_45_7]|nr:MAG: hypothetical protein BRD50_07540 [Bacteroidetes bacterium SW_11_45_7]